jgi:hypothetical protein
LVSSSSLTLPSFCVPFPLAKFSRQTNHCTFQTPQLPPPTSSSSSSVPSLLPPTTRQPNPQYSTLQTSQTPLIPTYDQQPSWHVLLSVVAQAICRATCAVVGWVMHGLRHMRFLCAWLASSWVAAGFGTPMCVAKRAMAGSACAPWCAFGAGRPSARGEDSSKYWIEANVPDF